MSERDPAPHYWPITVYYEDTDAAGVVYYANYLKFAERARTEFLRTLGFDHVGLAVEAGVSFVVLHCEAAYRAPAKLDDSLMVETRVVCVTGARFEMIQSVLRKDMILCDIKVRLGCIGRLGRAARLPRTVRNALSIVG